MIKDVACAYIGKYEGKRIEKGLCFNRKKHILDGHFVDGHCQEESYCEGYVPRCEEGCIFCHIPLVMKKRKMYLAGIKIIAEQPTCPVCGWWRKDGDWVVMPENQTMEEL